MNLKQGDLENIILNALWDLESGQESKVFVSHVQDHIKHERSEHKAWAYTTVKTVLDRLVDKELVSRHKEGKKYFYQSQLKRTEAGFVALKKLLRQYFQNDIPSLEQCLNQIKDQHQVGGTMQPVVGQKSFATKPNQMTPNAAGRPFGAPVMSNSVSSASFPVPSGSHS